MYIPPTTSVIITPTSAESAVDYVHALSIEKAMVVRSTGYHLSGEQSVRSTLHFVMGDGMPEQLNAIELHAADKGTFKIECGYGPMFDVTIDSMTLLPFGADNICVISVTTVERGPAPLWESLKKMSGGRAKRK